MVATSLAPALPAADLIEVDVDGTRMLATDVLEITLQGAAEELPGWELGAHIDVHLDNGMVRQYSLCGEPGGPSWRIAVLRELGGRGGSQFLHEHVKAGQRLVVSRPRNHFPLRRASSYVLIAGGIGITPLLPMARWLEAEGRPWQLWYGGRSRDHMSYQEDLEALGDKVEFWPQDERGFIPLAKRLQDPRPDTTIYCCGPPPLLEAVQQAASNWPAGSVQFERFQADSSLLDAPSEAFEIELATSGKVLEVSAETSVLEVLAAHGIRINTSCREGTCGTCEVAVLAGKVDHRDAVLDDEERAAHDCMFVCCSRALTPRLVLDL